MTLERDLTSDLSLQTSHICHKVSQLKSVVPNVKGTIIEAGRGLGLGCEGALLLWELTQIGCFRKVSTTNIALSTNGGTGGGSEKFGTKY